MSKQTTDPCSPFVLCLIRSSSIYRNLAYLHGMCPSSRNSDHRALHARYATYVRYVMAGFCCQQSRTKPRRAYLAALQPTAVTSDPTGGSIVIPEPGLGCTSLLPSDHAPERQSHSPRRLPQTKYQYRPAQEIRDTEQQSSYAGLLRNPRAGIYFTLVTKEHPLVSRLVDKGGNHKRWERDAHHRFYLIGKSFYCTE